METKQYLFCETKKIDVENRRIHVVASTDDLDRCGEIIRPSAFRKSLRSFKKNPVILSGHQHQTLDGRSPVIGSAVPETIQVTEHTLEFDMVFATTPLGEDTWVLYRDGHQRAWSVGFIPKKWQDVNDDSGRFHHREFIEVELLEVSAVPVPCNPAALARSKQWGEEGNLEHRLHRALSRLDEVHQECRQAMDQIEALAQRLDTLAPDSGGFGEAILLGDGSDSNPSAGREQAEQVIEAIKGIF